MAKKLCYYYMHTSKDSMFDRGEELGLEGKALDEFQYALNEVEFILEVDTETGGYQILCVDGQILNGTKSARELDLKIKVQNGTH